MINFTTESEHLTNFVQKFAPKFIFVFQSYIRKYWLARELWCRDQSWAEKNQTWFNQTRIWGTCTRDHWLLLFLKTWSSVKEWIPTILHFNHYPWYNIAPLLWLPRKKMLHWKVHPNNIIFRHRVIWIQSLFWIFRQRGWPRIHQCYVIFLAPVWPKWY